MGDSSASYIHLVQHLIEECLIFNMSKEESMEALSKHANILPVITSTVWKELEKENKEFFEAYKKKREDMDRSSGSATAAAAAAAAAAINDEFQTRQKFHQILLDSDAGPGGSTH